MSLNQINLYGVIGEDVKAKDVKASLEAMDQTQPLIVKIDSEGGSVFEGFSIANALEQYPGQKKVIIEPCAFSIASYIAAIFDDVEIVENGYVMAHMPYIEVGGTAAELAQNAQLLADMESKMVARYAQKTGMDEPQVRALLDKEEFLNAGQAQQIGLVSSVVRAQKKTRTPINAQSKLPLQVYASLRCESLGGENREPTEEKSMSSQPVAASVSEIKAAFPKAKAEFIVRCMEQAMPMPEVQQAMNTDLQSENEQMAARIADLEQQLAAMSAQAEVIVVPSEEEEEPAPPMMAAKAKSGVQPIARAASSSPAVQPAKTRWQKALDECLPLAGNKIKAAAMANRKYPGLREEMLSEVNG